MRTDLRTPVTTTGDAPPRPVAAQAARVPLAAWCAAALAGSALASLVAFPEGTPSPANRLVALGAVALGVALALAWSRLGTRLRGAGMLLAGFGAITVLGGVVVKRLATPSAVDVLGAVAGLAGIVLVVVGWRRLLGGGRPWLRAVAAVLGTLVVAQFLLLPAILALDVTNRTRPTGSGETPASRGLAFADVRIVADDGVVLAAWWVPSRNGAAVIALPGSGSTRDDVLDHAELVAGAGYGALLPDPRGHGDSGGRGMEFGWGAELDVPALATWVLARPEVTDGVGLLGLSMGGEVALTAAADEPRIGAVVAEGASARTWDDARREPDPHPVGLANAWVTFGIVDLLAPEAPPRPLVEAVGDLRAPTLLIAGAPANEARLGPIYAAAAPGVVTLWSLPDTPHVSGLSTHPAAYRERVLGHLDAALLGR